MPADESPARELIAAMVDELEAFYGRIDRPGMPSATADDFAPPDGVCLVGRLGDEPVCVGAVKRLGPGVAEIKRMYVAPAGRSQGVARALLGALEDAARARLLPRAAGHGAAPAPRARALRVRRLHGDPGDQTRIRPPRSGVRRSSRGAGGSPPTRVRSGDGGAFRRSPANLGELPRVVASPRRSARRRRRRASS